MARSCAIWAMVAGGTSRSRPGAMAAGARSPRLPCPRLHQSARRRSCWRQPISTMIRRIADADTATSERSASGVICCTTGRSTGGGSGSRSSGEGPWATCSPAPTRPGEIPAAAIMGGTRSEPEPTAPQECCLTHVSQGLPAVMARAPKTGFRAPRLLQLRRDAVRTGRFCDRGSECRFDLQAQLSAQPFREQTQTVTLASAARKDQIVPDIVDVLGLPSQGAH